jgi:hypothetical protein
MKDWIESQNAHLKIKLVQTLYNRDKEWTIAQLFSWYLQLQVLNFVL